MAGTDETPAKQARAKKAAPDPEELAADIEKTREELAETLDAIADKVSPKRVAKRTTKKVTAAVKETASEAAAVVKDTAGTAKEKVTRSDQSWAPAVKPVPVVEVVEEPTQALPSAAPVEVPALDTTPDRTPVTPVTPPASYPALPPTTSTPVAALVRPEYVVAGVFAALIAWLLVRRR